MIGALLYLVLRIALAALLGIALFILYELLKARKLRWDRVDYTAAENPVVFWGAAALCVVWAGSIGWALAVLMGL